MTDSLQHNITDHQPGERRLLDLKWADYTWPLLFLLSMAMMGLKFPLGYLLVPIILINRFRVDRYDFLIMLTIFFGGYGLIGEGTLPVKTWDLAFVASVIGALVYRKDQLVKNVLWLIVGYAVLLLFIASFSDERMMVQIRTIRGYLYFIYFVIPLIVFAGRTFNILVFFKKLMPYVICLCVFYVCDAFVFNGHILLPCTFSWTGDESVFYNPTLYGFATFPRIYPPGLFIAVLAVYPIVRLYRLCRWQFILFFMALGATRTFTVISGFLAEYVLSMPNLGKVVRYGVGVVVVLLAVYGLDAILPADNENGDSALRIYSSVQQVMNLEVAQDDEDIAELGSGRLGQAIPKIELVSEFNKELVGLGFLHPQLTTNTKYIIDNPFYNDQEKAEEVATGIEVEPLQVYVSCGFIGLIVHVLFFVATFLLIRKMPYSFYYLTVLFGLFWFGLGGFAQLNTADGLLICSLAYSLVILDNRNRKPQ